MNELEQHIAILKERGATEADIAAYTQEYMAQRGTRPDATAALQRERDNATGDWEAIPQGFKTAAEVGITSIPVGGAATAAAKKVAPYLPAAFAAAKELPLGRNVARGIRAWRGVQNAQKMLPKPSPVAGEIKPTAQTLEDLLGAMEVLPEEQIAPTLEARLGDVVRNQSPVKQQGATKARFEHFADQFAKRQAAQAPEAAAEPTLEELLSLSTQFREKGVPLSKLNEIGQRVRPK